MIIRSHEGPDAREKREGMEGMDQGYTIDHEVQSGKLITVFSAPDYPQFQVSSILPFTISYFFTLHRPWSEFVFCVILEYAVHVSFLKTSGVFTFRCLVEV